MKVYTTENIRNVCLVGDKGVGKTSCTEAMLYTAKLTTRLGKVDEGNTVVDYDPMEIDRKQTLLAKPVAIEWQDRKINVLDTPGYADFIGEAVSALAVADTACLMLDTVRHVTISTGKFYEICAKMNKPLCFFLNRLDSSRSDQNESLKQIQEMTGSHAVLFTLPCGEGESFNGIVDLLEMKAYTAKDGKVEEMPIPADILEEAKAAHTQLQESAAETDESLMNKYLEAGELSHAELTKALVSGFVKRDFFPVFVGSASQNIGVKNFLDALVHVFPSPAEVLTPKCRHQNEEKQLRQDSSGPVAVQVFKVTADPGLGEIFYLKVFSGKLASGIDLVNAAKGSSERMGHLFAMRAKERIEVAEVFAGDIVSTARLKSVGIQDTLCEKKDTVQFDNFPYPEPSLSFAMLVKSRQEQDKLGAGISKLMATDPTFKMRIDKEFAETIISGMGDQHIDVIVERLNQRYGVKPELAKPHIAYRETITKKGDGQGKYKKQTGGHGQYGDCWLKLEPLSRGTGFEFVDNIVGGSIPGKFIPSVEKGVKEAMTRGILAGYQVQDMRVTVFDGSYHDVDSSDLAFQMAASMGFKKIMESCGVQLLEPVMNVEVFVPSEFVGDVTNDMSSRRGRIQSMDHQGNVDIIKAQAPEAELYKYSTTLRSMTSGAGTYTMSYSHYEPVPPHMVTKIVEETQKEKEAKEKEK
ncbi:MAG: elongation factor G [Deltaproteobacteria bacterium]|nr:elongation factor G [Deltaproteobacteria bacterium]